MTLSTTICPYVLIKFAEESSDLLVRRKRLIDRSRNGNRPVTRIQDVPYIVSVYELEEFSCSGNIILVNVIITTAVCVFNGNIPEIYSVRSGSAYRQAGNPHRVLKIRHHPELSTNQMNGDIALLTINPPIDRRVNTPIPLYIGQIPPHTLATVSGWGHTNIRRYENNILIIYRKILLFARFLDYKYETKIPNLYFLNHSNGRGP